MKFLILSLAAVAAFQAHAFEVSSTDVKNDVSLTQEQVFNGFGCTGENLSPQVAWHNPPKGTKSFAVTMYDPDAPTGSGWWHWTVFNIPATTSSLSTNAGAVGSTQLPAGAVQGRTDFGFAGFGGACPPKGDKAHHYQLTVWALNTDKLPLDEQASGALVGFMLNGHSLGKAQIAPTFRR